MVKEEVGKKEKRIKSLKKEIDQWNHGIDKFQSQIDEQEEEHKKKKFWAHDFRKKYKKSRKNKIRRNQKIEWNTKRKGHTQEEKGRIGDYLGIGKGCSKCQTKNRYFFRLKKF